MRFDTDSFKEEITNKAEAQNCYRYLVQNLGEVQKELHEANLPYEQVEQFFVNVWKNLITSCDRVGYTNAHIEDVRKALG